MVSTGDYHHYDYDDKKIMGVMSVAQWQGECWKEELAGVMLYNGIPMQQRPMKISTRRQPEGRGHCNRTHYYKARSHVNTSSPGGTKQQLGTQLILLCTFTTRIGVFNEEPGFGTPLEAGCIDGTQML